MTRARHVVDPTVAQATELLPPSVPRAAHPIRSGGAHRRRPVRRFDPDAAHPIRSGGAHRRRPARRSGIGGWVHRWRRILALAVLLSVAALPEAATAQSRMSAGAFIARGQAYRADQTLATDFPQASTELVVLARSAAGVNAAPNAAAAAALTRRLAGDPGVAAVTSYWSGGELAALRSSDGHTGLLLIALRGDEKRRVATAIRLLPLISSHDVGPLHLDATGDAAVQAALHKQMESDLVRAELITTPIALAVLVLVFGSVVAACLPLLIAGLTVLGTFTALFALTYVVDVSVFSLNLTTAIGLGLTIDYCLLIITRFREQLAHGDEVGYAVRTSVRTAGRTVWFSAVTVALGFAAPMVFPAMRPLGYAGIIASLLSAAMATTVLPAALGLLGDRVNRLDPLRKWHRRPPADDHGFWFNLMQAVMRRPVIVLSAVIAFLLVLAAPFVGARFGMQDERTLPAANPVRAATEQLIADFPAVPMGPIRVVLPGLDPTRNSTTLNSYAAHLSTLPGAAEVQTATGTYVGGLRSGPTDITARYTSAAGSWIDVDTAGDPYSSSALSLVHLIRSEPTPSSVLVGGLSANLVDTGHQLGEGLPWALLIIVVSTLAALFLFTGSVVIPIKALGLNVLSLTATFGAMVFIFQQGHLRWLVGNFTPTGRVDIGMPILVFCVAFGLAMDYEVFLLSRISEEYRACGDNTRAVAVGIQRSGRVVTAAAALISLVFAGLATSQVSSMKLLSVGLALAVILDATLVRMLLVPAFMKLAGSANWWCPQPLRRLHARLGLTD